MKKNWNGTTGFALDSPAAAASPPNSLQRAKALLILLALLLSACHARKLPENRGPPLRPDLPPISPSTIADHGYLRYSGESRLVGKGFDVEWVEVPGKLESCLARFQNPRGQQISLIATVHTAHSQYYQKLTKILQSADWVLYEDARGLHSGKQQTPKPIPSQWVTQQVLFQDHRLDKARTKRADLDGESIRAHLATLGLSFPKNSQTTAPMTQREAHEGAMKLVENSGESIPKNLHRLSAEEFRDRKPRSLELADYALIYRRDDAVMETLESLLKANPTKLHIALLYGAAHGHDLENRLFERGFRKIAVQWIEAWNLNRAGE